MVKLIFGEISALIYRKDSRTDRLNKIRKVLKDHVTFNKLVSVFTLTSFFVAFVFGDVMVGAQELGLFSSGVKVAGSSPSLGTVALNRYADMALPYSYGLVGYERKNGVGNRKIAIVQDLHCHPQVQENIGLILSFLDKKYGINKIYLEGAYGEVNTEWLKPAGDAGYMERMLMSGKVTGAESYSASKGRFDMISGMEDEAAYIGNISRSELLMRHSAEIGVILKRLEWVSAGLRTRYFNNGQKVVESKVNRFLSGGIEDSEYYEYILKELGILGIDVNKYENLELYLEFQNLRNTLKYEVIKTEVDGLVSEIKSKLPYGLYNEIAQDTKYFSDIYVLCGYLEKISREHGVNVGAYNELGKLMKFIDGSRSINYIEMYVESVRAVEEIKERYALSEVEYEVVFVSDFVKYISDYLGGRITANDYEYYKSNADRYRKLYKRYINDGLLELLDKYIRVADEFYEVNNERNSHFERNIFDGYSSDDIDSISNAYDNDLCKDGKIDVVITGGFHTESMRQIFEERGISYMVITPSFDGAAGGMSVAQNVYKSLISEQGNLIEKSAFAPAVVSMVDSLSLVQQILLWFSMDENIARELYGSAINELLDGVIEIKNTGVRFKTINGKVKVIDSAGMSVDKLDISLNFANQLSGAAMLLKGNEMGGDVLSKAAQKIKKKLENDGKNELAQRVSSSTLEFVDFNKMCNTYNVGGDISPFIRVAKAYEDNEGVGDIAKQFLVITETYKGLIGGINKSLTRASNVARMKVLKRTETGRIQKSMLTVTGNAGKGFFEILFDEIIASLFSGFVGLHKEAGVGVHLGSWSIKIVSYLTFFALLFVCIAWIMPAVVPFFGIASCGALYDAMIVIGSVVSSFVALKTMVLMNVVVHGLWNFFSGSRWFGGKKLEIENDENTVKEDDLKRVMAERKSEGIVFGLFVGLSILGVTLGVIFGPMLASFLGVGLAGALVQGICAVIFAALVAVIMLVVTQIKSIIVRKKFITDNEQQQGRILTEPLQVGNIHDEQDNKLENTFINIEKELYSTTDLPTADEISKMSQKIIEITGYNKNQFIGILADIFDNYKLFAALSKCEAEFAALEAEISSSSTAAFSAADIQSRIRNVKSNFNKTAKKLLKNVKHSGAHATNTEAKFMEFVRLFRERLDSASVSVLPVAAASIKTGNYGFIETRISELMRDGYGNMEIGEKVLREIVELEYEELASDPDGFVAGHANGIRGGSEYLAGLVKSGKSKAEVIREHMRIDRNYINEIVLAVKKVVEKGLYEWVRTGGIVRKVLKNLELGAVGKVSGNVVLFSDSNRKIGERMQSEGFQSVVCSIDATNVESDGWRKFRGVRLSDDFGRGFEIYWKFGKFGSVEVSFCSENGDKLDLELAMNAFSRELDKGDDMGIFKGISDNVIIGGDVSSSDDILNAIRNKNIDRENLPSREIILDISGKDKVLGNMSNFIGDKFRSKGVKTFVLNQNQMIDLDMCGKREYFRERGVRFIISENCYNAMTSGYSIKYDGAQIDASSIVEVSQAVKLLESIKKAREIEAGDGIFCRVSVFFNDDILGGFLKKGIDIARKYNVIVIASGSSQYLTSDMEARVESKAEFDAILRSGNSKLINITNENILHGVHKVSLNYNASELDNASKYDMGMRVGLSFASGVAFSGDIADLKPILMQSGVESGLVSDVDKSKVKDVLYAEWDKFSLSARNRMEYLMNNQKYYELIGLVRGLAMLNVFGKLQTVIKDKVGAEASMAYLEDRTSKDYVKALLTLAMQLELSGRDICTLIGEVPTSSRMEDANGTSAQEYLDGVRMRVNGKAEEVIGNSRYSIENLLNINESAELFREFGVVVFDRLSNMDKLKKVGMLTLSSIKDLMSAA
jgi:hypothetical protein